MYDLAEDFEKETAILAAVDTGEYDCETSIAELNELCETADIEVVDIITQKRPTLDVATVLGEGKIEELQDLVEKLKSKMIIFDTELSPAQIKNIEDICNCPVLDRTMLILNIFSRHAVTSEGKLQVELANLRYQLPRLLGKGVQMSRQGGGGAGGGGARRGTGETKAEVDRRHIKKRIETLQDELKEVAKRRQMIRSRRKKDSVITVAIVGYTNVGKSTLLNYLTQAGVLAENKLFATLDPTSRGLTLPDGREIMLVDTVGLVRRLPHHLVEAFKSTLEEAAQANLILNICDITDSDVEEKRKVTLNVLKDMGAENIPVITVYNKCDKLTEDPLVLKNEVLISAKTGKNIDELLTAIENELPNSHTRLLILIPYEKSYIESKILQNGKVYSREYLDDGIALDINIDNKNLHLIDTKWVQHHK